MDFAPGARLVDLDQVHGDRVVAAEEIASSDATPSGPPRADGVVSSSGDVVLMVRVADCVPVLLADAGAGIIGAAHAGRRGVELGVVPATIDAMRARGAGRIEAWIGPHVCGACYEVPAALRDDVDAVVPGVAATTSWGTPSLDLGRGVRAQLEAREVVVHDRSACTIESPDLYSYRRDGARSGRFAGLIRRV